MNVISPPPHTHQALETKIFNIGIERPKRKLRYYTADDLENNSNDSYLTTNSNKSTIWTLDSGASCHMTGIMENECGAFRTAALKNLHKFLIS